MKILDGRIGQFVKAARSLLLVQAAVALLAVGLSVWAFVAVRELAADRDRLQARVAELEAQQPAVAPAAAPPAELPPENNMTAPSSAVIVPVPVPVTGTDPVPPPDPVLDPPKDEPDGNPPRAEQDCPGPNGTRMPCRPRRWERPQRPLQPVAPEPQSATNQQKPSRIN